MRLYFSALIFLLLSITKVKAQSSPVSSGGEASGSGGSASYSLGEVFFSSYATSGGYVIEGVQQAYSETELPITLLEFKASVNAIKQIDISWETVSERNNHFFTVERSANGISFSSVITLNSKGNSVGNQTYNTIDVTPYAGTSYYRLKQTDIDGKSTYSKSIAVSISTNDNELTAFPNPTTSLLNLSIKNAAFRKLTYQVFSTEGKLIEQQKITNDLTTISTSKLVNGAYLLQVIQNGITIKSFRIIKN